MQRLVLFFPAFRFFWALTLVTGIALAVSPSHAQPLGAKGLQPPPAVQPIALPQILARADDDQQRVDRAQRLLAVADPTVGLQAALDDIARPVDAKLHNAAGAALHELSVMRLESLARHWQFDARRYERWEAQARRTLAPYADSALQLAQRRAAWSATRAEGLLDGLPAVLAERVEGMLGGIDATESALGAALARQFELMRRASELKVRIEAGGNDVAAAIAEIDRGLLRNDAPPLWRGLGADAGAASPMQQMDRGLEIERQFAIDYNAAATGNQRALRVVQLLLLPTIVWLIYRSRRSLRAGPEGAGSASALGAPSDAASRVLSRPLSAWLLLSLLAVLAFEPDAPLLVQEFVLLFAAVPALRLLPAGTLHALGAWPYVAVALYALDRAGVAVPADKATYRVFLLALNGLALGLTVWLLRRTMAAASPGAGLRAPLRFVAWAVLLLLAVAAVANFVGNVSLAETLTSGVIDSGAMALLLYAGVTACLGLLQALWGQPEWAQRRVVREHGPLLQTACARLVVLGAAIGWLLYSMDRFRLLRPLHDVGASVLSFGIDVGEVSIHVGDVLVFAISAWLALWAARAVRRLLRDELPGHAGLPRGAGNSIASLSYYGVLILGLLIALSAAGFKVSQLTLVFGALGVGIGFGLQTVVNNFVSGLVLMFERPIQPGDVVDVAGSSGTVRTIGLRATVIRTFDGADVVVPNGLLLSGNLTNWTMFDRSRRVEVLVSVAYGSDPVQVMAVLQAAAGTTPGVAASPAPAVSMTGYGDSGLNFAVRFWTHDVGNWGSLRSDLLARMLGALEAAGINIPFNQLDVNVRHLAEP
ncbi:MAG: mechanosensitive ion channel [Comamonadaceae bacterium]|nr:MAG: mechanosensitive ion channel [Comamonadaceae bacterium]